MIVPSMLYYVLPYIISDPIRKYIKVYKKDNLPDDTNELISLPKKLSWN